MSNVIDGASFAAVLRAEITRKVATIKVRHGVTPGLAVVLVGDDPASRVYVRNKGRQTVECGMNSYEHALPVETTQETLLALIGQLNADNDVHGILVQLPLPGQIDAGAVIDAIDADKDVDGFHPVNVGRLSIGAEGIVPCTPLGSLMLLKNHLGDLSGKHAVVVGRSTIVGKPMAALLLREHCTVTVAHSRTIDLPSVCRRADILVAAVGRPEIVKGDWIKPGAAVIDVGINRIDGDSGKTRLVGDVEYSSASQVAGLITPVPGGVGPMTIAVLLHNTMQQACRLSGIEMPAYDHK